MPVIAEPHVLTEAQFARKIDGKHLTPEELQVLRKDYGLPYNEGLVLGLSIPDYYLTIAQQKVHNNPFLH